MGIQIWFHQCALDSLHRLLMPPLDKNTPCSQKPILSLAVWALSSVCVLVYAGGLLLTLSAVLGYRLHQTHLENSSSGAVSVLFWSHTI